MDERRFLDGEAPEEEKEPEADDLYDTDPDDPHFNEYFDKDIFKITLTEEEEASCEDFRAWITGQFKSGKLQHIFMFVNQISKRAYIEMLGDWTEEQIKEAVQAMDNDYDEEESYYDFWFKGMEYNPDEEFYGHLGLEMILRTWLIEEFTMRRNVILHAAVEKRAGRKIRPEYTAINAFALIAPEERCLLSDEEMDAIFDGRALTEERIDRVYEMILWDLDKKKDRN
jgi:aromatic ring-cleaving dioxygenase